MQEHGYTIDMLRRESIGQFLSREFIEYKREVTWGNRVNVTFFLMGANLDFSRWIFGHDFYKNDSKKICCTVIVEGQWVDLKKRKPTHCPPILADGIREISKSKDFIVLDKLGKCLAPQKI